MVDTQSLLSFFGRPSSDQDLNAYMARNNISPNSELALGDDEYRAYIERSGEGFCLVFTDEAVFQGKDDQAIGVGELYYTWIFFHAEGKDDYAQYKGELPGGISFSDTRKDVLKKMGTPSWQRMSKDGQRIIADRWELPNYRLHVTYSKKTGKPEVVSAGIPDAGG